MGDRIPFNRPFIAGSEMDYERDGARFYLKQGGAFRPGQDRVLDGRTWDDLPWRAR